MAAGRFQTAPAFPFATAFATAPGRLGTIAEGAASAAMLSSTEGTEEASDTVGLRDRARDEVTATVGPGGRSGERSWGRIA